MYADPARVARIDAEPSAFDPARIEDAEHLLPGGDDAVEEVEWLVGEKLVAWFATAHTATAGLPAPRRREVVRVHGRMRPGPGGPAGRTELQAAAVDHRGRA
ncbi:hypothetical protein [Catenuloplanes indicus]|uniref:Uncharacterized protein n=1 Tax=Catenuloplanes indicus TaxID=137267 RepID=A0AAE4AX31_9ACTN|nr:hypothetical protein [Catenuloplanes indicus]MDQ0363738.1 hypothetical protein [Catenuloplanes indicus]